MVFKWCSVYRDALGNPTKEKEWVFFLKGMVLGTWLIVS